MCTWRETQSKNVPHDCRCLFACVQHGSYTITSCIDKPILGCYNSIGLTVVCAPNGNTILGTCATTKTTAEDGCLHLGSIPYGSCTVTCCADGPVLSYLNSIGLIVICAPDGKHTSEDVLNDCRCLFACEQHPVQQLQRDLLCRWTHSELS